MQTLSELFKSTVEKNPSKIFIKYKDQEVTYHEMDIKTNKLANVLLKFGIKKGDAVGLYLPSCIELAIGYYACQKIGAVAVPMSSMYKSSEVGNIVERTKMQLIITTKENYFIAEEISKSHSSLKYLITVRDIVKASISFEEEMEKADTSLEKVRSNLDDPAVVFFTSGTTGQPKGAMQTHKSIYAAVESMNNFWKFQYGKEIILCTLPIFNNFGATVNMNGALLNGGTLILHERWNAEAALQAISEEGVTFFSGAPTMFISMLDAYDPDEYDVSSLRLCVFGGASIPSEVITRVEETLKVKLIQIYGATETSGAITAEPIYGERKLSSVGVPFGSTVIKIIDESGHEVSPEEIGEIVIESDAVGSGYWNDQKATKTAFRKEGWYSGDIGYVDREGYLYIIDRKKDIIITNGNNVFPIEIEEVLYSLKAISLAAVIGIPDKVKGEVPKAFIKLKQEESLAKEEVIHYCKQKLATYKVPRSIQFVEEFPLGPTGKILKRELQKL